MIFLALVPDPETKHAIFIMLSGLGE